MPEQPIRFDGEELSNAARSDVARYEPRSLRTYTPTQAVLARSAGIWHWTPEGRKLYDYTSGVLVANLGHNPRAWLERLWKYLGWTGASGGMGGSSALGRDGSEIAFEPLTSDAFLDAAPLTAYNAVTTLEAEASRRLVANLRRYPGGNRMEQVLWAASGSEAVQKALWAALKRQPGRDVILATRHGFHGKKGLAGACTGSEKDPERDPRVKFISFPMTESARSPVPSPRRGGGSGRGADESFDLSPYEQELERLQQEYGNRLSCLITEPYLGGAGSFHPPAAYLQLLERFCRANDLVFILDEVQSNFGRTGKMYAFETYGIEPDVVVLGKGMGNGAAVSAAVGRGDVLGSLGYGEGSDTYSANPLSCAAVLATLDLFESVDFDVLAHTGKVSAIFEEGLLALKGTVPFVTHVRGEGMVWGVEVGEHGSLNDRDVANACVRACYLGDAAGNAIHLLGPLAGNVLRVSPPLVISEQEARRSLGVLANVFNQLAQVVTQPRTQAVAT
jgi:4-aminobutyrate aminotransferase-like enzyme